MFYKKCLSGKYSIRKFSVGICSVMIGGLFFATSMQVKAEELSTVENNVVVSNLAKETIAYDKVEDSLESNSDNSPSTDVLNAAKLEVLPDIKEVVTNEQLNDSNKPEELVIEDAIQELNLISNPTFDGGDYVSSKPIPIIHRSKNKRDYISSDSGNTFYKSKENTTNDFLLFEVNTVAGRTYTASADIRLDVADGFSASGAYFDVKSINSDGSQITIPGGKGVNSMSDSIGQWSKQEIKFTAIGNRTHIGLVKWHDNSSDLNTLKTSIKIDNLKVVENTSYEEVWKETFSGERLNDDIWGYELGNIRGNEQQHYSSSTENVYIKDGNLILKVTDRPEEDQYYNRQKHGKNARLVHYNSGSVRTVGKQEFLYGRLEAKMKLPKGQAVFPAFWTLGADFTLDGRIETGQGYGWPSTGEIDIMELTGTAAGQGNKTVYGTPHFFYSKGDADKDGNAGSGYSGTLSLSDDFANDFHIFGINWSEDRIEWYVDNVVYNTLVYDNSERSQALKKAFNRPQFIQFNLATGGNWPGTAGKNLSGQKVEIDWVRWLQSDEQKIARDTYYANKPIINGVRNISIVKGEVPNLLDGVTINLPNYNVEYSIDDEYMFVNTGEPGGRNEVRNVVKNSSQASQIADLAPGVYNVYYTSIPKSSDYNGRGEPIHKMTRELSQLVILPTKLNGELGKNLSMVELPTGWQWENPDDIITENGSYGIVFINPNDKIKPDYRRAFTTTVNNSILL
ncbi:family 16 glycosylhydrolase [Streptococcus sp. S784/96/1]|uniref:family 16 glycosylhydrolase n=1 Tax=Streptococcus sp. S784/96/1 TaxID=2653499 RepID=UPI0013866927|nr:family 16 glycosylhydrolase [Streptococcus sp. S784/96/1]